MDQRRRDELLEQLLEAQTSRAARLWDIATKAAVPILPTAMLGLIGWLWAHERALQEHHGRLGVIEDTRFSRRDGAEMEQRIYREFVTRLDTMSQTLATLVAKLEGLQDRLDRESR